MSSRFFILGLPRSRTAWLANWFTYGGSFCLHDAGRFAPTARELATVLDDIAGSRPELRFVGSSDSSLGPQFDDLVDTFPGSRFLLVEREVEESVAWAAENGMSADAVRRAHAAHQEIRTDPRILAMPYRDLNIRAAQEWLTPGEPFDELRHLQLEGLNMTVNMSDYFTWCEAS